MGAERNQFTIKRLIGLTVVVAVLCAIARRFVGNELALTFFLFYVIPLSLWSVIRIPRIKRDLGELRRKRARRKAEIEQLLDSQKKKLSNEK